MEEPVQGRRQDFSKGGPHCVKQRLIAKILSGKTNFKKWAFQQWLSRLRYRHGVFRHLHIVGCLLKKRPTKGVSRAPHDQPPLAKPLPAQIWCSRTAKAWNKVLKSSSMPHIYSSIYHDAAIGQHQTSSETRNYCSYETMLKKWTILNLTVQMGEQHAEKS